MDHQGVRWRIVVRVGVAAVSVVNLWWGVWALVDPRGFFDTFPGFGHHWTAAYPPYNQHLVSDLGAIFLTLGFLLAIAAVLDDRKVIATVLAGAILFNALHLTFHATHHGMLTGFDLGASLAILAAGVVAPAILLAITLRVRAASAETPR